MGTKTRITGLVIAIAALATPMVYADNGGNFSGGGEASKGGHESHYGKHHLMAGILNLTQDQQKQLKEIKKKQRETMKSTFKEIRSNKEALDAEIMKAAPDMNKVNDLQTKLKAIQAQMTDNHLNSMLEIKKILTPEQFAGYMALEKEKKLKGGHHQFGQKGAWGKHGGEHKDWGNKGDKEHSSDSE